MRWSRASRLVLLLLTVAAAAVLRFTDINWDRFQHVHPDERFIVWVAETVTWPADAAAVLDPARSPLNPLRWPPDPVNPNNELAGKPRNYAYGHFPLYLLVAAAHLAQAIAAWLGETTLAFPAWMQPLHTVGRQMTSYNYLPLVGRALSALADLGTLLLVYALARRTVSHTIFCRAERVNSSSLVALSVQRSISSHASRPFADIAPSRVLADGPAQGDIKSTPEKDIAKDWSRGFSRLLCPSAKPPKGSIPLATTCSFSLPLLAAALYAFAVLPIQLSHFATVDAVLTFCVTATLTLAVRRAEGGGPAVWLLAGLMAGLAVGSKFSAVLLAVPLLAASFFRLPDGPRGRRTVIVAGRLAAVAGAAFVAFAITNPFALLEARAYGMQIFTQNAMVSGMMDAPYTRQYVGTLPYLYFVQQLGQWGLGWPLGIAAWSGFTWAIVRVLRWRAAVPSPALVILLAWAVPYFATTGLFHAKFLRYMAPLLPCLLAFAAGWAAAGWDWFSRRFRGRGRAAWATAAGVTLAVTAVWALAFTGVYRQEHPWIAASKWIYTNLPAGAKVLTEHWDDALPLALDELPDRPLKRSYEGVELPLWEADATAKLETLVAELSTADYIVIASNRLYAPVQRLRSRYPMSNQYYRMLFAGDLGYQPVAEFTAYPNLLGITIPDDNADESFTVYDHPRVLVFENVGRYKPELLRARLGRYLPAAVSSAASDENVAEHPFDELRAGSSAGHYSLSVLAGRAAQDACLFSAQDACLRVHPRSSASDIQTNSRLASSGRPPGLARMMPQTAAPGSALLDQPVDTLPVVTDFRWNRAAGASTPLATLLWWLAVSLFGWAAWPLLFPVLRGLADRGYGLARPAGWLVVGWVHWLGVSLGWWENRLLPIALILGVFSLVGLVAWRAQRREIAAWSRTRRRIIPGAELLFGLAYLVFVGVRLLNPDLWHPWNGGEKFMESAFLNAILRSAHFPPYDPYFAGGVINYYYYGFYLVSLPIKLTGIAPEVAFNLAVPALFALTAGGVFSVAYTLAAPRAGKGGTRTGADGRGRLFGVQGARLFSRSSAQSTIGKAVILNSTSRRGRLLRPVVTFAASGGSQTRRKLNVIGSGLTPGLPPRRESSEESQAVTRPFARITSRRTSRVSPAQGDNGGSCDNMFLQRRGHPALTALLSVGMTVLMGNLKGLDWLGKALSSLLRGEALPRYDYWAASRVIPYTINEFPLWTFTFADLHPHLIAMPFGLLVVGLALHCAVGRGQEEQGSGGIGQGSGAGRRRSVVNGQRSRLTALLVSVCPCLLLALSLGALGAINTWDVPTYGLLVAGAFVLAAWRSGARRRLQVAPVSGEVLPGAEEPPSAQPDCLDPPARAGFAKGAAIPIARPLSAAGSLILVAALSTSAYLPFHTHYDPTFGGEAGPLLARYLGWVRAASPLGDWLTVWGAWLALVLSYLAVVWWGVLRRRRPARAVANVGAAAARRDGPLFALLALLGLLAVLAALGRPTAALALLPLCMLLPLVFRRSAAIAQRFLALLVALALAVVAGTELIYVRDFLEGGEWYRMNTLFKFSTPAWLLLGVAGGPMLRRVWGAAQRAPRVLGIPWQAAMAVLLAGSLTFLAVGMRVRVDDRFPGQWPPFGTLDGTAYMTVSSYFWPTADDVIELSSEREAIRWLLENVNGSPLIAEAPAGWYTVNGAPVGYDYYRAGGLRVASFTGLPTFLGAHQSEQRSGEQVGQRSAEGQVFFTTTDIAQARALLRDLRVGYVYVGQLERTLFSGEALRKFDVLVELGDFQVVYRNPQVTIYRVVR